LNGLLLFHVLLWALCVWAGFVFLRARSGGRPRAPDSDASDPRDGHGSDGAAGGAGAPFLFSLAFFGISITPIYLVWLTPEILHVALVFLACFLWLYREVAPPPGEQVGRWARFLRGSSSLWVGAILLGIATFSKPPNLLLVGPPVILLWQRRRWLAGLAVGMLTGLTILACFGVNGLISGDFNYQGGDRKTFYGRFPFADPDTRYDDAGISMSTNELGSDEIRDEEAFGGRLRRNAFYFVAGRHAGFVPYFFPGVVVLVLWAARRSARPLWQWSILAVVVASVLALMVVLPYSWAGGGGPPGNRYFLSIYPTLFFLTPPLTSIGPALAAWAGGAAFVAHILVNPFVAAKSPWQNAQRGLLRRLPVELTMVNDLPVMLNGARARVPYGQDPGLLLYFLDEHTYLPEPAGLWVAGGETSEIIVRTDQPLDRFTVTLRAIAPTRVRLSAGGAARETTLAPGTVATLTVPADGVATRGAHAFLFRVSTSGGAVPALVDPNSRDPRYLGVLMEIRGHRRSGSTP
jgi:hypothetical protein